MKELHFTNQGYLGNFSGSQAGLLFLARELLCLHLSLLRILRYDLECDGVKFKSHQVTSTYIKLPYHPIDSHPILIRFSSTSFNIFMLRVRATNLRYVTGEIFLPSPDIFCCDRTPHTTCQRVPKCSKPRQLPLVPVSKTQDSNALVLL